MTFSKLLVNSIPVLSFHVNRTCRQKSRNPAPAENMGKPLQFVYLYVNTETGAPNSTSIFFSIITDVNRLKNGLESLAKHHFLHGEVQL